MQTDTWQTTMSRSFQNVWNEIAAFLPDLLVAILLLLIGWLIASAIGKMVTRLLRTLDADQFLRESGAEVSFSRTGHRIDVSQLVGKLVKWFLLVIVLVTVFDTLGLEQINAFLTGQLLPFLPHVLVAIVVILIATVLAGLAENAIRILAETAGVRNAAFLGTIARTALWTLGILIAVSELGIAEEFIHAVFIGLVGALSLALGLSFGLGGRQAASDYIARMRESSIPRGGRPH